MYIYSIDTTEPNPHVAKAQNPEKFHRLLFRILVNKRGMKVTYVIKKKIDIYFNQIHTMRIKLQRSEFQCKS
jgi:hypothetical protein